MIVFLKTKRLIFNGFMTKIISQDRSRFCIFVREI